MRQATRGPGRPKGVRASDAEARREAILDAAARVFAVQGYAAASTRALAAEAGVNVGTLAYHFGGKEGLYEAVLDRLYGQLLTLEIPAVAAERVEERIHHLVGMLYRFVRARRDMVRVLLVHVLQHGRLPDRVRERHVSQTLDQVARLEAVLELPNLLDRRLELLSLNHLLARYAVTDSRDLTGFVQGDSEVAVAEHLGEVACRLLLVDGYGKV